MMRLIIIAAGLCMLLNLGCDFGTNNKDTNIPAITTETYKGAVRDNVTAQQLPPSFNYDSTRFTYVVTSDGNYEVDVLVAVAMPTSKVETGTWIKSGSTYTFTPLKGWASNSTTHAMEPADTLRGTHVGATSGTDITINNFINIGNKSVLRNLGTLVLHKQ